MKIQSFVNLYIKLLTRTAVIASPNTSSYAQHTVRPNNWKHSNLEQRKVYGRVKQGEWVACAQKPQLPNGPEGEASMVKIWDGDYRVCDFLLIHWWWDNRVVLQESYAQPEVTSLTRVEALVSVEELKNMLCISIFLKEEPRSCFNGYTIVSAPLCFYIPSLL